MNGLRLDGGTEVMVTGWSAEWTLVRVWNETMQLWTGPHCVPSDAPISNTTSKPDAPPEEGDRGGEVDPLQRPMSSLPLLNT